MLVNFGHRANAIANYLLSLAQRDNRPITPMQLLKLVYISHGWMLGLYGRPLTKDPAEAWKYGPVFPSVYHRFKEYGSLPITCQVHTDMKEDFDPEEQSVIRQVWDYYSRFSGIQLSALTHQAGTPWDFTMRTSGAGSVISNDLIAQHYNQLAQRG